MPDISYSNLKPEYAKQLAQLEPILFPNSSPDELFHEEDFLHHAQTFPECVFVALDGDQPVGIGAGIFIDFDFEHPQHNIDEFIGGGYCTNHDPEGDYYYGTDIGVHPAYRRRGIGHKLYVLRKGVVKQYNKKGIIAGGVLPGFANYKDKMTALDYVNKVAAGELYDATLTFQIQNGFEVHGVLENYFSYPEADDYASLIFWPNPDYRG